MGGALLFKSSPGHSDINPSMRSTCVKYQVKVMTLGGGSKDGVEAGLTHDVLGSGLYKQFESLKMSVRRPF